MSLLKKLTLVSMVFLLIFSSAALSREKPIRIEAKLGLPNLVGGSVEYLLPALGNAYIDNSIAPYIDFSTFNLPLDETTEMGFGYFGFGAKYYLDQQLEKFGLPAMLKGVYGGLGFGRMSLELTDDGWDSYTHGSGTATGSVGMGMFQLLIGKRWFWGPFTLCIETGYSLGNMDDEVTVEVEYEDGYTEEDTQDISDVPLGAGTMGTLSVGIAL